MRFARSAIHASYTSETQRKRIAVGSDGLRAKSGAGIRGTERLRLLRGAIAGLRPSSRRALEIHTLQGRSVEEMASEIGISVCAAKGSSVSREGGAAEVASVTQHPATSRAGDKSFEGRLSAPTNSV